MIQRKYSLQDGIETNWIVYDSVMKAIVARTLCGCCFDDLGLWSMKVNVVVGQRRIAVLYLKNRWGEAALFRMGNRMLGIVLMIDLWK